jgi:hypothetical protein
MEQNGSSLFPQYTLMGSGTPNRQSSTEHARSPSGAKIKGFLDAFEGLTLMYDQGIENPIWLIESQATTFTIDPSAPETALTNYDIFLGTEFGNRATAEKYGFRESRAFGFIH